MTDPFRGRDLHDLAAGQHGAAHRNQLLALLIPSSTIDDWVLQGRMLAAAPEVLVVAGSPPTWRQRVMVATLTTGGWASHRTAAALHGLDGFSPGLIEVVTDRAGWRRRAGLVRHTAKDLRDVDDDLIDGIPTTSLVRTLLDLPAVCSADRASIAWDDAIRRHGDELLGSLRSRFLEVARRGRNGTVKGRQLLADRTGEWMRTDSVFEARFLRLVQDGGLPRPTSQLHVQLPGGRSAYLDFGWAPQRVGAECDSLAHHFGHRKFQLDRTRRRALTRAGWEIYEYTYDDLSTRPHLILEELREALTRRSGRAQAGMTG